MINYSDKEQRLFHAFGMEYFLKYEPAIAYQALALYCFSTNIQNSYADSVRRCYNAMMGCAPHRLTPEFDDLIDLTN
jgi:hypothetical protein